MKWLAGLFACKSIEGLIAQSEGAPSTALPRTLGLFSLTCFGVGSTIGAGIFVLTGTVAAQHAGPAIVLSFLLASVACAFAGLCYAEFAAMVPVAGSAYTYAYATLGELAAWTIGWCLVVEYLLAASLVAIGWSGYAVSMAADYGVRLPPSLTQAPFDVTAAGLVLTGGLFNVPAAAVLILCTALLLLGTQVSARLNDLIVVVKVAAILIIGIAGLAFAHPSHWTPFMPPNAGSFGQFGISGVVTGAAILFYAYIGFDAVSAMAQETRNAQRVVPMALIASLVVCAVLYILVALMVTGLADYRSLGVSDPIDVAIAAGGRGMAWAKPLVGAVVVVGLISVLLVTLLGQVRIFYAMGRDGLLPRMFIIVDPRSGTPRMGTIVTGASAAIIAGLVPLNLLDELISIGTLLAFAIVCMGVMVLRRRRPELPRPFRVPWYPWIPLAGILVCVVLMSSLPWDTWVRLLVWLAVGLVVYGAYGARHSVLRRAPDEDFGHRAGVNHE